MRHRWNQRIQTRSVRKCQTEYYQSNIENIPVPFLSVMYPNTPVTDPTPYILAQTPHPATHLTTPPPQTHGSDWLHLSVENQAKWRLPEMLHTTRHVALHAHSSVYHELRILLAVWAEDGENTGENAAKERAEGVKWKKVMGWRVKLRCSQADAARRRSVRCPPPPAYPHPRP